VKKQIVRFRLAGKFFASCRKNAVILTSREKSRWAHLLFARAFCQYRFCFYARKKKGSIFQGRKKDDDDIIILIRPVAFLPAK
jgi:hypothetical protein